MRKKLTALILALLLVFGIAGCGGKGPVTGYHFNGGDLKNIQFARLPVGSILAEGHLKERLTAQADNITYDMYELDRDLYNSLIFGNGTHTGVPSAAYYLRGLAMTAYTLGKDDPVGAKLIARTEALLENIYAYAEQYASDPSYGGLYVPPSAQNWVDKQEVGAALQMRYEYEGHVKSLELLENYYKWLQKDLSVNAMAGNWEGARKADVFDSGIWVYNHTKKDDVKAAVAAVLQKLTEQSIDWADIAVNNTYGHYNFHTRHIVNVTQGLKEPMLFGQLAGAESGEAAFMASLENLTRDHGRVDGLINGSEQLSGKSSIEAVETCAVVEMIASLDRAYQMTGNIDLADRIEKIGYNSLPASFSPDMKSISYFNPSNLVRIVPGEGSGYSDVYYDGNPGYTTDADEDLGLGPHPACHCCSVNCHIGYPEFIGSMVYATDDNGAAVALYGPSTASVRVGKKAQTISIRQTTNYPFEDTVKISVGTDATVKFPLRLRIPAWAPAASVTVNGQAISVSAGQYLTLDRKWTASDVVEIDFNPVVTQSRWANNSLGVTRGALVYSTYIGERYDAYRVAGTTASGKAYNDYKVFPTTDWNYGLVLDKTNFSDNFEPVIHTDQANSTKNYFDKSRYADIQSAPIALKVKAKKLDDWTINDNGILAEEVPVSPVVSDAAEETIYLVPYGAGKLKISNIPEIASQSKAGEAYVNDFSVNALDDFLYYGPAYTVTNKGFGTYFKTGYGVGPESTFGNDKENAWGQSAFNPKAVLGGRVYTDFTLETTLSPKGSSIDNYGVLFRATDFSHSRHGFKGYYAAVDHKKDKLYLYKTYYDATAKHNAAQLLGEADVTVSIVSGVKLKVVCSGSSIEVYANGQRKLAVTDATYAAGQVGLVVHAFGFDVPWGKVASSVNKLDLAFAAKRFAVTPA